MSNVDETRKNNTSILWRLEKTSVRISTLSGIKTFSLSTGSFPQGHVHTCGHCLPSFKNSLSQSRVPLCPSLFAPRYSSVPRKSCLGLLLAVALPLTLKPTRIVLRLCRSPKLYESPTTCRSLTSPVVNSLSSSSWTSQ